MGRNTSPMLLILKQTRELYDIQNELELEFMKTIRKNKLLKIRKNKLLNLKK
jgi:hypothetical protein